MTEPDTSSTYRNRMRRMAVTSPPELGPVVFRRILGARVADIGCGSGVFGYMLRAAWHMTGAWKQEGISAPDALIGVDFSTVAVELLNQRKVYDRVLLADAAGLPLEDDEVDTAISMENIEHIYAVDVANAIGELARVAKRRVVISTPAPWRVHPVAWTVSELASVTHSDDPMAYAEFLVRAGQIHKSVLFPDQMQRAGFSYRRFLGRPQITADSIIYWADVNDIKPDRLGPIVGVPGNGFPSDDGREDWSAEYAELLQATQQQSFPKRQPVRTTLGEMAKPIKLAVQPHTADS